MGYWNWNVDFAHLTNTNVFSYDTEYDRYTVYSPCHVDLSLEKDLTTRSIYLKYSNRVHFEVVVSTCSYDWICCVICMHHRTCPYIPCDDLAILFALMQRSSSMYAVFLPRGATLEESTQLSWHVVLMCDAKESHRKRLNWYTCHAMYSTCPRRHVHGKCTVPHTRNLPERRQKPWRWLDMVHIHQSVYDKQTLNTPGSLSRNLESKVYNLWY